MNRRDTEALNELIEVTIDSADGYREASKNASNPNFKRLFEDRATSRNQIVRVLQEKARSLGGNPPDEGSMLASAHRMFVNLKNTVTGGDDKSVIEEVERGEDHIKAKYEDALKDPDVSADIRTTISSLYEGVRADHDRMRDLKHSLQRA